MNYEDNKSKFFDPFTHLVVEGVAISVKFYMENFSFSETYRDKKYNPDHVDLALNSFQIAISSITMTSICNSN